MTQEWRSQRGFSLFELVLVLLITGLMIGALWVYLGTVQEKNKRTKLSTQVSQIITRTKNMFANADITSITGNITPRATTAGIFPSDMSPRSGSSLPVHAYGGTTRLDVSTGITGTPRGRSFNLQLSAIPIEACSDLLMRFVPTPGTRRQLGIVGYLYAAQGSVDIVYPGTATVTAGEITRYCNASDSIALSRRIFSLYFVN